jgi:hypothetical protein
MPTAFLSDLWSFYSFQQLFYEYQAFYPKTRKRPHVGMSNDLIYKQKTMYFQKILVCKSPSRGPLLPLLAHGLHESFLI